MIDTLNNTEGRITAGSSRFRRVNLALFCAGFITFVTLYDIQPLLPLFSSEFIVTPAVGSLPLSISTFTLAFTMLLMGTISETFGRKPIMVTALFLTSLLAILTCFSTTFPSLLVIRFMQGIVLAGVPSVAMAYLAEEMDSSAVASAMGLYISGNAVGGMTGRVISAIMSDYMPWRTAIGLIGCLSLLLALLFAKNLPESGNFRKHPFEISYLATSIIQHLRDPGLLLLFGIAFLCMGGFISLYNYIGFRLLDKPYSMSQSSISLIFLVYFFGSLSSAMIGRLILRFGRRFLIRLTILAMFAGTLLTLASPIPWIVAGVAMFTCGFFGVHTIASSWVGRRAITAKAQAASLYLFFYYLGSSISGTVGGVFWVQHGWRGITVMICLLLLLALICAETLSHLFPHQRS
jgi:YNFM family putative membrane transporter